MKVIGTSGLTYRGFYTEEIRESGDRKGFRIKTFDGKEGILAHVEYRGKPRVGKYGVDVESFEAIALPELEAALQVRPGESASGTSGQIIVIDEIGKMELFSQKFKELVIKALDSPYLFLGVIKDHGDGFIRGIKARQDVRLFTLTMENRNYLMQEVLNALNSVMG